jgi:hypothetical protein
MLVDFLKGNHFKITTATMPGLWGAKGPAYIKCTVGSQSMCMLFICMLLGHSGLWAPGRGRRDGPGVIPGTPQKLSAEYRSSERVQGQAVGALVRIWSAAASRCCTGAFL